MTVILANEGEGGGREALLSLQSSILLAGSHWLSFGVDVSTTGNTAEMKHSSLFLLFCQFTPLFSCAFAAAAILRRRL